MLAHVPNTPAGGAPSRFASFTQNGETKGLRASAHFENRPNPPAGRDV
jgi:hypothetical protein